MLLIQQIGIIMNSATMCPDEILQTQIHKLHIWLPQGMVHFLPFGLQNFPLDSRGFVSF